VLRNAVVCSPAVATVTSNRVIRSMAVPFL
jgi:hypothetical protein